MNGPDQATFDAGGMGVEGDVGAAKRKGTLGVILGGVATSFLALFGMWLLGETVDNFNIMGWYAMLVIPAGAIFVGMRVWVTASYRGCGESRLRASCCSACWPYK